MRKRLSNRRRVTTVEFDFAGARFIGSAGYYDDGQLGEVFLVGAKPGSAMDFLVSDGMILLSLLLQHGVSRETIASSLSRHPDRSPASIISAAVDELATLDGIRGDA
jgi:hypothetical protein